MVSLPLIMPASYSGTGKERSHVIRRIRIQNFRSLVDVTVDLNPLTVMIGRSGTGKSNFVHAIRFLRDILIERKWVSPKGSQYILPIANPEAQLSYTIAFEIPGFKGEFEYQLELPKGLAASPLQMESLHVDGKTIFEQQNGEWVIKPNIQPCPSPDALQLGSLTGLREATVAYVALTEGLGCYDFLGNVLQPTVQNRNGAIGFDDRGGNYLATASGIINNLDRLIDWLDVSRSLMALNSAIRKIDLQLPERSKIVVGYENREQLFDVSEESEGFRRMLAYLLALYQTPAKQTMLFEHPENNIHPGALQTLFEAFDSHVKEGRGQVILTTHSPDFLDYFHVDDIRVVTIENQTTRIGLLAPEQKEGVVERLLLPGELLTVDEARLEGQLSEVPG